jgi:hypothetical protein
MTLEPAFDITVTIGPAQEVGETAQGRRRIIPITGGRFEGPNLSGIVVPGGADWQLVRPDGVAEIEARYTLQTHDGVLIYITNTGLRHGPPEVMRRLASGEPVKPAEYYFRTVPIFELKTGTPYDWLTRALFVATGSRYPDRVVISVWRVR